ncbi:hypothetical protein CYMTET_14163 [Cymbomonas tetramitiformis]|uniref:SAM-dependent MTase RsmB/NOP-type domain-containing protein n=1 Tax=Cymbomonas tetramitiformis TaxID=36881 RepID=A0AAE0GGK0_9CHLO|nr:hypothetical protein CYMTET_14163 [Cymbomonas tetramitiformis]
MRRLLCSPLSRGTERKWTLTVCVKPWNCKLPLGQCCSKQSRQYSPASTRRIRTRQTMSSSDSSSQTNEMYSNTKFPAYYKATLQLEDHDFERMISSFKEPLPAVFRLRLDSPSREAVKAELNRLVGTEVSLEGGALRACTELEWYPEHLAYSLGCDRRTLRKNPELAAFHDWVTWHVDSGDITRQEAVSMVPPLLLRVQKHHHVLDMCAAPGSKTSQLLEMVSSTVTGEEGLSACPEGFVVANDADRDRCFMLIKNTLRLRSPALMVTNHEATHLPNLNLDAILRGPELEGDAEAEASSHPVVDETGVFDRVLADVPCSGDGTIRKNPTAWHRWTPRGAYTLHPVQLQVALRGAALLKQGGYMVYSTCSLNPIEDEAVVAELLRQTGGALQLVDCSDDLPQLKRRPGLESWLVMDDKAMSVRERKQSRRDRNAAPRPEEEVSAERTAEMLEYATWDSIADESRRGLIHASCFPPSAEEASELQLRRCMRILPQDNDTGGFFVAVLRKVAPLPSFAGPTKRRYKRIQAKLAAGKVTGSSPPCMS